MQEMIYMPVEIIFERIMTALEFVKAMHYHDEGYEHDNDYGFPPELQGLSTFTQSSQPRPPSTKLNSPQPSPQSYPSLLDIPEAYHSKKGSAST